MLTLGPSEIARLDQNPNAPENGRLTLPAARWTMSDAVWMLRRRCEDRDPAPERGQPSGPHRADLSRRQLCRILRDDARPADRVQCCRFPASEGGTDNVMPLAGLTTRDPSDPSIALLDAWAVVADVLTFYQERIANEGYLPTRHRAAVAAGAVAADWLSAASRRRPPACGSPSPSAAASPAPCRPAPARRAFPAPGETAQFFETSAPSTCATPGIRSPPG